MEGTTMRYIIASLFASGLAATTLHAEPPRVVTDLPAVHALASQVMQGLGEPVLLLDRGADPHSFQLRPGQAAALAEADLILWIGPEMTPWLDRAIDGLGRAGASLPLLAAEGSYRRSFATEAEDGHDHDHDHGEGAAHEGHDHDAHEGHRHDGLDPHAWLDPANAAHWTHLIAAELARRDPENAATYRANAEATVAGIEALDAELARRLAPIADRPFVVFHDAYGYFADHYGLTVAGSVALGDASDPGAARLSELRRKLSEAGVVCLFPEAQHDPAPIARLAEATGAKVGGTLDPSGATLAPGADAYAALMLGLADTLTGCLGAEG
jgi:zinc transport system substrate-binding protein